MGYLTEEEPFQQRVKPWFYQCFPVEVCENVLERNDRALEEMLELNQSLGYTKQRAHALVEYVFNRDVGEPAQEVGGVMVTLAALCIAAGLDMHDCGDLELARIKLPEVMEKIRAKQESKRASLPPDAPFPTFFDILPLDEDVRFILGKMPWESREIAVMLRYQGADIPTRCEEEQAAAMQWLLRMYLLYGKGNWQHVMRNHIQKYVDERRANEWREKEKSDG